MRYLQLQILQNIVLIISLLCFACYGFLYFSWDRDNDFPEGGTNIAFILDVSQSMLVRDMGDMTRLDWAKNEIVELLSRHRWAEFALSVFAGESVRVLPFTGDVWVFQTFLGWLSSDNLSVQGTQINLALEDALLSFGTDRTGTLVILTDGDEDDINIDSTVLKALKDQSLDIKIVWIWTESGWNIVEGIDPFGRIVYKVYEGERVVARLNEIWLKSLAKDLWGQYYDAGEDIGISFGWNKMQESYTPEKKFLWLALLSWICFIICSIYPLYKT